MVEKAARIIKSRSIWVREQLIQMNCDLLCNIKKGGMILYDFGQNPAWNGDGNLFIFNFVLLYERINTNLRRKQM